MSQIAFDNSYARLPGRFHHAQPPAPVAEPRMIAVNADLAERLGIDAAILSEHPDWIAGNAVPPGAEPLAMAYAGHQFGNFSPQLGDGRALLLGEVVGRDGIRRDIQLKGSGRTPYSRMGDGRAAIGPVIREYILSEAMHALGVPTTRALAAATTGEAVRRQEGPLPGAVIARVAQSHVRVGTFEFFYARDDVEALRVLTDYCIARHYPDAADAPLPARAFLDRVVERQAKLVARWMQLGFIHGVMNTDNCQIAGETIDYGPCAFMDGFNPAKVFSSIDTGGRYAWGNQGRIAHWNVSRLAQALLPLMGEGDAGLAQAQAAVDRFPALFEEAHVAGFAAKLGIARPRAGDADLVTATLDMLGERGMDYTLFFRHLRDATEEDTPLDALMGGNLPAEWRARWRARIADERDPQGLMATVNPVRIARNHRVEEAIKAAEAGNYAPFKALLDALAKPYEVDVRLAAFEAPPMPEQEIAVTFCGT